MPKRVSNGLTLLSAVVCVGSAMLVGRSFFWSDVVLVPMGHGNGLGASTRDANLWLWHERDAATVSYSSARTAMARAFFNSIWRDSRGIRWLGIGLGNYSGQNNLILPLWLLPLLTAIAPVRWWRSRRRERGRGFAVEAAAAGKAG